ncbi:MAG: hypothetical protein JWQ84_3251 [Mucilaginibacter sp.]|jgi:hypothetical protein|nr:hypothetical protein [Mucilaginibacter sp.]MDB5018419.1 hypothetical protein [Mucilaginibacter sp.]MDB5141046.1 hypothetical protein [Mucilaginibacter sp.]
MKDNNKAEAPETQALHMKENYEDEYWSKKYGVSTEELKEKGNDVGISTKIIDAYFKKKSFSL